MNEAWVMSIKTSLTGELAHFKDLETEFVIFENFENAKKMFRKLLKEFAFSKNDMFDGNGNIIYFKKYIDDMLDEKIIDDFETLDKNRLNNVLNALRDAFSGKDFDFEMESKYATDWFIAIESEPGSIFIRGEDDGPCNGYDPYIKTNIFSMEEEKNYYLYIDDLFGQDYSAGLYMDLKKAKIK